MPWKILCIVVTNTGIGTMEYAGEWGITIVPNNYSKYCKQTGDNRREILDSNNGVYDLILPYKQVPTRDVGYSRLTSWCQGGELDPLPLENFAEISFKLRCDKPIYICIDNFTNFFWNKMRLNKLCIDVTNTHVGTTKYAREREIAIVLNNYSNYCKEKYLGWKFFFILHSLYISKNSNCSESNVKKLTYNGNDKGGDAVGKRKACGNRKWLLSINFQVPRLIVRTSPTVKFCGTLFSKIRCDKLNYVRIYNVTNYF